MGTCNDAYSCPIMANGSCLCERRKMQVDGLRYCHGHQGSMLRAQSKPAYRHCHICGGRVLLLDTNSICEGHRLSIMPRHYVVSVMLNQCRVKVYGWRCREQSLFKPECVCKCEKQNVTASDHFETFASWDVHPMRHTPPGQSEYLTELINWGHKYF